MRAAAAPRPKPTKGEQTAARILDAAEAVFAARGYEGASLREIARAACIQQPGLYNHFGSKRALYEAVLDRALEPMLEAMRAHPGRRGLPAAIADILLAHPKLAALFHQALQGDTRSPGNRLVRRWLGRLFGEALRTLEAHGLAGLPRAELAIRVVAMFNVTTGYFLSQRALDAMQGGAITDPANLARQKRLLERVARAILVT